MIHNIKIQYPYADTIINNRKTFEVRLNDRGYNVGDTIQFRVMDGSIDMPHILNDIEYEITYVYSGLGLEKGFVVFGIKQKARWKKMANFPTYEEVIKNVAERALDEYLYQGKSIREWAKIITEQEPCEDAISRKAVLDMTTAIRTSDYSRIIEVVDIDDVKALPSVKPQTPLNVNELLNKIRAEIVEMDLEGRVDAHTLFIRTPEQVKQMALEIIDKYKAESEENNAK